MNANASGKNNGGKRDVDIKNQHETLLIAIVITSLSNCVSVHLLLIYK